jgi:putative ABC transport system permease protein
VSQLRTFLTRLVAIFRRRHHEAGLHDEIATHLELLAADYRARGLSRADAQAAARRDFGGVDQVKETVRDRRGFVWVDIVRQDARYALRSLSRTPAFTVASVSTLAVGIAATTAIFSVANAALLRPLPYPHWEDLRTLRTTFTDGRVTSGLVGPLEMSRLRDSGVPIMTVAMSASQDLTVLRNDSTPLAIAASGIDEQFFPLFGIPLEVGSGFTPDYFRKNGPGGVIISHRLWRALFDGDPKIVGKSLALATGNLTILGVASPNMDVPRGTDLWLNLQLEGQDTNHGFDGYLRVRPSTPAGVLSARLAAVASALGKDFPGPEGNRAFIVAPFVETMVGDLRPMLIIVLSATALLLVLACVNVANLLLARASRRSREVAIRAAIGASRARIATQLLTESLVLASAGTLAGLGLAYAAVRVLLLYGVSKFPRLETVPFDAPVLFFAIGMLVVCAFGVGLAPVLTLAGRDLERPLREGGRTVGSARSTHRALRTMIMAEVAVAVTIVAGTGLLVRSFLNLQREDAGFDSRGRVTFNVLLGGPRYRDPRLRHDWSHTLLTNIRAVHGVTAVAASSDFPMNPSGGRLLIQMDDWSESHVHVVARRSVVTPTFFEAMGMRVTRGRGFTDDDRASTAPVVIVNESFVRKYLDGRDPLTAGFAFGFPRVDRASLRPIVGVVNDVKYESLWSTGEPVFYLVENQAPGAMFLLNVVVATDAPDVRAAIPAIGAEVRRMDPQLAFRVEPVSEVVAATLVRQRLGTTLMLLFGAMALLLASIGIYGMIAYASAERHGEVATRMALGATRGNIFVLLSRQGLVVAFTGAVIGLGLAYATSSLASSWLYDVRPSDPVVLASALMLVLGVTVIATLIPVGRAARIDPSRALRFE